MVGAVIASATALQLVRCPCRRSGVLRGGPGLRVLSGVWSPLPPLSRAAAFRKPLAHLPPLVVG